MLTTLATIVLVGAVGLLAAGLLRALNRAWLVHRVRLGMLRRLEHDPALVNRLGEVESLLAAVGDEIRPRPALDYVLTGVLLAALGLALAVAGHVLRAGSLAVGTYVGGLISVVLGLVFAAAGLVARTWVRFR